MYISPNTLTGYTDLVRAEHEKVVKVFPDRILQLHTTRSWDFLEAQSGLGSERAHKRASSDIIIGLIDTGTSLQCRL